ncbi:MAG TPA: nitroreductase/quinone reductase family protein [Dermatophilaceae bacterium]|nr:nitroreductase/quinone reductase family protein [Dermatophilaceae bacterium]
MGLWTDLACEAPRPGPLARGIMAVTVTPWGARAGSRVIPVLDDAARRLTHGRTTLTESLVDLPTIELVTTGARTGARRVTHLVAVRAGDDIAVLGTNFGTARTPAWVHNLRAQPRVEVGHGTRTLPALATEVHGADAERMWEAARRTYAGFALYRGRVTTREITVWLLTRRDGDRG